MAETISWEKSMESWTLHHTWAGSTDGGGRRAHSEHEGKEEEHV